MAIAERLSRTRKLILHGRDVARLERCRECCSNSGVHLLWQQDFKEIENVTTSLTRFLTANGCRVVEFVHSAGQVHVLSARSADLRQVLDSLSVNYIAAQQIISTLLKKSVNGGQLRSVVVVSSIWSQFGARGHSLYCASKAALDGMVRSLAVELAPGVRINSVLPGAIRTPMAEVAFTDPAIAERFQATYPLGIGRPEDIAGAVEFLLSENALWVTGHQFVVDGGRTSNMSL